MGRLNWGGHVADLRIGQWTFAAQGGGLGSEAGCELHFLSPSFAAVDAKLTGFQDSEPVVALVASAQRPGPVLFAAVFPEFIARVNRSQRVTGRQGGKRRVGAVRSRRRGLGPASLDGPAPLATVADKAMNLGKTASGLWARALRRINAARRAPVRAADTPDWIGLADQAQPGRRYRRGAKRSAAGMACKAIPWSASAARRPVGPKASGIKAERPRRATRRGATPASPTAKAGMYRGAGTRLSSFLNHTGFRGGSLV